MNISVVIPLYNKEKYIEETLGSLLRQTRLPDQVIVVDDASTDASVAHAAAGLSRLITAGVGHVELLRSPNNIGPSRARNQGLQRATGEVLAFLDADDCWREDCCARILAAIGDHALDILVLGYVSTPPGEQFPNLEILRDHVVARGADLHLLPHLTRTAGHPGFFMGRASNVAVRRRVIGDERFTEGRHVNENIDFWYRIARRLRGSDADGAGPAAGLLAAPLIQYRILPDSLSHRRYSDWWRLEIPPSLQRFRDSKDADDRRLGGMLGRRWLKFAMESLPGAADRAIFCQAHGPLLAEYGVELPDLQEGA